MTYPTWPDTLPQFAEREGFKRQRADGRLRSPTDFGPGKVRRRFSATPRRITPTFYMTRVQLERFGAFWDDDTKGGTLPFFFPEPGRHGFPLRADSGDILISGDGRPLLISALVLVMFAPDADPPSDSSLGDDLWPVDLSLDILP